MMSFIEEFAVENLFLLLSVLSDSGKTCYFRTVFALLLSTMVSEPYLLLTNSSFILIPSESYRGCQFIIGIKFDIYI